MNWILIEYALQSSIFYGESMLENEILWKNGYYKRKYDMKVESSRKMWQFKLSAGLFTCKHFELMCVVIPHETTCMQSAPIVSTHLWTEYDVWFFFFLSIYLWILMWLQSWDCFCLASIEIRKWFQCLSVYLFEDEQVNISTMTWVSWDADRWRYRCSCS